MRARKKDELRRLARRPSRYGRRRALALAGVWLFFGLHFLHWRLTGKSLAPLELHEVMYTAELGVITAGFLLMGAALISVAVFGRFFCSWGCHVLALEDASAWLLARFRIRPRFPRSRALAVVPAATLVYMFIWPHVARWVGNTWPGARALVVARPEPHSFRVITDAQGWASFVTTNFWRNLPGPWIGFLTLAVCGFAIVLFLGSRSFCAYACPYGALFAAADRVAPGRITLRGSCDGCGLCTAACPSHIRVHDDVARHGMVMDSRCMKGLSCVSACPPGALAFGYARPPFAAALGRWRTWGFGAMRGWWRARMETWRSRARYDFSAWEEILASLAFLATLVVFRDLYGLVPFLMTLGLGVILAFLAVTGWRLATRGDVAMGARPLRRAGRWTRTGAGYAAFLALVGLFFLHCGFIRRHERGARRDLARVEAAIRAGSPPDGAAAASARGHLETLARWGLVRPPDLDRSLASIYMAAGPADLAEGALRRVLARRPRDPEAHLALGEELAGRGALGEAEGEFRAALASCPTMARARFNLGGALALEGKDAEAIAAYREAVRLAPDDAETHLNLARLLARNGDPAGSARELGAAAALDPRYRDLLPGREGR